MPPATPPADYLHVGRPHPGDRALFDALVEGMFARGWYSNGGPLVAELEARLREYLGVGHCVLVNNATAGLQLASRALDLTGEVIVPAFTFIASAHAIQWLGLRPVFCEIDPLTHNLDPRQVEALVTERTSAILGVHLWGRPCATEALTKIAERHGLQLFYDAAHAFGVRHGGRMVGNFGRCEVFSFHATKFVHTFEGGAIATNDDALAERLRRLRNFGLGGGEGAEELGINCKMPEVCAAMGLASLKNLAEVVAANRRGHDLYGEHLAGIPGIELLRFDDLEQTNWQYLVLEVTPAAGVSRDRLLQLLHADKILARRYFFPGCHRAEPYATLYPEQRERLPLTDSLCQRVLVLPNGPAVSAEHIEYIGALIRRAVSGARLSPARR